ncbi:PQQ-binding-like beta-propeller repeat protein [Adhaeribacter aquaticus]|uniref:outer membrane protein assembly factor BamB family protein n=1 Tax=Adhaeribacter aquaticus TaxID=299567 RepID=UPI000416E140|nr:PQQ-binding-like beta-propeller repeat protein [Adhaeribacter aquaticus]
MGNTTAFIYSFLKKKYRWFIPSLAVITCAGCHFFVSSKEVITDTDRTWSIYKADAASSSYSKLKQINLKNVNQLTVAWSFPFQDAPEGSRGARSECNPIIIDGVLYATSARHRVYALNASTGDQIWTFDPFNGAQGGGVNRGVTYWEKGEDKRILFTAGDNLFAVDARTGKLILSFGKEGKISLNEGMRDPAESISVIPTSPGIIYEDYIIIGSEVSELYGAQPGYIRAYNVKTGQLEWTFHTVPLPGEPGYETWPKDAWKYAGGVNDWAGMSLDQQRGLVFLALGSPSYDFYGADRKGQNLYGNCIVALDAKTGKPKWHFQTIHHDLWDYDLPAPPNLVTVERDGKKIDAVAQTSKVGFLYVLNRETGESLFPIEERKVPASLVPGEEAWPTQPFPLKPKPYARQLITKDDLNHYSDASYDTILKRFNSFRYEGLFTPPDTRGTLMVPGSRGGAEWGGAAFDPATGIIYVRSNDSPEIDILKKLEQDPESGSQTVFDKGKAFYTNYCQSCHGADKNGDEPNYPSLVGLNSKLKKEDALNKIKKGGGKMPAFASILKGQEEAIISFLYEKPPAKISKSDQALLDEIKVNQAAQKKAVAEDPATGDRYLNITAYGYFTDPQGRPAIKPPWGTLNAINVSTGEYAWTIPLGNNPDLQQKGTPPTGLEGMPGPIATAGGLIFIAGTRDNKLHAYDKKTGKLVWETNLPAIGSATPCTYMSKGKQYVAISVAGDKNNPAGYIMAFALPDN